MIVTDAMSLLTSLRDGFVQLLLDDSQAIDNIKDINEFLSILNNVENDSGKTSSIQHCFTQNDPAVIKKILSYVLSPVIYDKLSPNQQNEWFLKLEFTYFSKNSKMHSDMQRYQEFVQLLYQGVDEEDAISCADQIITLIKLYQSLCTLSDTEEITVERFKRSFQEILSAELERMQWHHHNSEVVKVIKQAIVKKFSTILFLSSLSSSNTSSVRHLRRISSEPKMMSSSPLFFITTGLSTLSISELPLFTQTIDSEDLESPSQRN